MYNPITTEDFDKWITAESRTFEVKCEVMDGADTVVLSGTGQSGDIISMEWNNVICSNDGLQIGTTCMDEFKMTYRNKDGLPSLMNKEIHPYVGLVCPHENTGDVTVWIPLGIFYVTNTETADEDKTFTLTAYDGMQKLLGNFDATALGVTFPINAWALLTAIATHFDLTVSYDKLTYELLTSDNYTLTTSNGDTLLVQQEINANQQAPLNKPLEGTYRDYVGWIVGLVGANAHMGRSGDLHVGRYENHGVVIGRDVQHMGGAKINYGGSVTYECIVSGTDESPLYPTNHSGNSITYTNPYITQEELDILNDALFADGNVVVTPCDVTWRSNPCVDAGDIVSVVDKDGNNSLTYVMERVVRITGGLAEDLHCYAETEVVHTLNKSPLITKFAQLTNDIKEAVNPIDATKGTFEFIDNGDGTNGGFTIYENGTNSWLRCTAGGLGISADGGLTYTNAITKNGVVASRLDVQTNGTTILSSGASDMSSYLRYSNADGKLLMNLYTSKSASATTPDCTRMTFFDPYYNTGAMMLYVGTSTLGDTRVGGSSSIDLYNALNKATAVRMACTYSDNNTSNHSSVSLWDSTGLSTYAPIQLNVQRSGNNVNSSVGLYDPSTNNGVIRMVSANDSGALHVRSNNQTYILTLRSVTINGTTYYLLAST